MKVEASGSRIYLNLTEEIVNKFKDSDGLAVKKIKLYSVIDANSVQVSP